MSVQVDYLAKIPQFSNNKNEPNDRRAAGKSLPALQIRAKHLPHNHALDWMAAQTAIILAFENGRLNDKFENETASQALAFATLTHRNTAIDLDFVTRLGDKLSALQPDSHHLAEPDEAFQTIWSPGISIFDKVGGEVFEIDADLNIDKAEKVSNDKRAVNSPVKKQIENDRQVELAEALRWTVSTGAIR